MSDPTPTDAEMTTDIPALLAEVERLRAELAAARGALARVETLADQWGRNRDMLRRRADGKRPADSMDRREANTWDVAAEQVRAALQPAASEQGQGATDEAPADAYPAGHGWTPGHGKFSSGPPACRVMLARYPCNWSQEQHDPDLPPVDVDVFGYRRKRATDEGAGA